MKIIKDLYGNINFDLLHLHSKIQLESEEDYNTDFTYIIKTFYNTGTENYMFESVYYKFKIQKNNTLNLTPKVLLYKKNSSDKYIFQRFLDDNDSFQLLNIFIYENNGFVDFNNFYPLYNLDLTINFDDFQIPILDFVNNSRFILTTKAINDFEINDEYLNGYQIQIKKDNDNKLYLDNSINKDMENYTNIPNSINKMILTSDEKLSLSNFNLIIDNSFETINYLQKNFDEEKKIMYFKIFDEGEQDINLFKLSFNEEIKDNLNYTTLCLEPMPLEKGLETHYVDYLYTLNNSLFTLSYNTKNDKNYIPLSGFKLDLNNPKIYTMSDSPILINEYPKLIQENNEYYIKLKISDLDIPENNFDLTRTKLSPNNPDETIYFDEDGDIIIEDNLEQYRKSGLDSDKAYYAGKIIKFKINKSKLKKSTVYNFTLEIFPDFSSSFTFYLPNLLTIDTDQNGDINIINPFNDDTENFYFTANQTVYFNLNENFIEKIKSMKLVFSKDYNYSNYYEINLSDNLPNSYLNYKITYDKEKKRVIIKHDIGESICYITHGSFFLEIELNNENNKTINNQKIYKSKVYTNIPIKNISISNDDTTLNELIPNYPTGDKSPKIKYLESKVNEFLINHPFIIYNGILHQEENLKNKFPVLWFKNNKLINSEIINIDNLDNITPLKYDMLNEKKNLLELGYDTNDNLINNNKLYILSLNYSDSGIYYPKYKYYLFNLPIYLKGLETELTIEKSITEQNAYNLLNKDALLDNDYYKSYTKWVDNLLLLTIYLLVIILKVLYSKRDLSAEELFDEISKLFKTDRTYIKLCDTENEIASLCGEKFFKDNITTMLNQLGKTYTYDNSYNKNADITLFEPNQPTNDLVNLKKKMLDQIEKYVKVSQIFPTYLSYYDFKTSSQDLLDEYKVVLESIPPKKATSGTGNEDIKKNYSDVFSDSLNSITDLYDKLILLSTISTSDSIKSLIFKVLDAADMINAVDIINDLTNPLYSLSLEIKYLANTFVNATTLDDMKRILPGFTGLYKLYTEQKGTFNSFIVQLNEALKDNGKEEINIDSNNSNNDIENIRQYTQWVGYTANKIVGDSFNVGYVATSVAQRLDKLSNNELVFNPNTISLNKTQDRIKIPISDPNNLLPNSEFYYEYKNELLKQRDDVIINVSVLKLDINSNLEISYYGSQYSPKSNTIPVTYSEESLEKMYLNKKNETKEYSLETSSYTLPEFWYGETVTGVSVKLGVQQLTSIDESKKTYKLREASNFFIRNQDINATEPIIQIDVYNPNENMDNVYKYIPNDNTRELVLIKIDDNGNFNVVVRGFLQRSINNLQLNTGTYFIAISNPSICLTSSATILTPKGYVKITDLKIGNSVITSNNKIVKIQNIKKMTLIPPPDNLPHLIPASSLDKNYPPKNVILSGKHAILMPNKKEWFIPNYSKKFNNKIIELKQEKPITYYHIELPNYLEDNLVINNGCVVESCGNKKYNVYYKKSNNGLLIRKSRNIIKIKKI